jgi:CheY-like chemotaxis protein
MTTPSGLSNPGKNYCRVLIIEDDSDSADSLRDALAFDGHKIAVAHNALDGITKARELRPDVVVCDIGLPGTDGYSVARAFRADESLRNTCLVALSGYGGRDDMENAKQAGFTHHFTKPLSVESLQQLLRELSSNRDVPR